VLQGPIGIGIGLVFGYLYGSMLQYLPSRNAVSCQTKARTQTQLVLRVLLVLLLVLERAALKMHIQ